MRDREKRAKLLMLARAPTGHQKATAAGGPAWPPVCVMLEERMMPECTVTATELKTRLGAYLDAAQTGPVFIEKSGRPSHVLLSRAQYEQLLVYEDFWWGQQAQRAEAEGYVGETEARGALRRDLSVALNELLADTRLPEVRASGEDT